MTRFKEGRRIERALLTRDASELQWALSYAESRLRIAPSERERQSWKQLIRRITAAQVE